jgi:hypothetical protein
VVSPVNAEQLLAARLAAHPTPERCTRTVARHAEPGHRACTRLVVRDPDDRVVAE